MVNDQCNIVGVSPVDQDEYIPTRIVYNGASQKYGYAVANGGRVNVLTVTAGKTFYLETISLQAFALNTASPTLELNDDSSVLQHYFYTMLMIADQIDSFSKSFNPALEIPAGWKIDAFVSSANGFLIAQAYGWEK